MSVIVIVFFFALFWPTEAFAWGPSAHLQYGLHILDNLSLLPSELQTLLGFYKQQYLYGCISADIIVGKKFTAYRHHCHNWLVGMRLLQQSEDRQRRAFMFGYLSHLAADTVAHNLFVPTKVIESYKTPAKGHLYWELMFDNPMTDQRILDMFYSLAQNPFQEEDEFLRRALKPTLFSFPTNKRIFNGLLILQRLRRWQTLMGKVSKRASGLDEAEVQYYSKLSINAILSFLIDRQESRFFSADPTGQSILQESKKLAKSLRSGKRGAFDFEVTLESAKQRVVLAFEQNLGESWTQSEQSSLV